MLNAVLALVVHRPPSNDTIVSTNTDVDDAELADDAPTAIVDPPSKVYANRHPGRDAASTNSMLLCASIVKLSTNAGQIVTGTTVSTRHVNTIDAPTLPAASTDHSVTTGASPFTNDNDSVANVAFTAVAVPD